MGRLGEIKAKRLLRVLLKLGFRIRTQEGSHRLMEHSDGRTLLCAFHDKETVGPRALAKILKDGKIDRDEYRRIA